MDLIHAARLRVLSYSSPFKTQDGHVSYKFRDVGDLEAEEDEGYLPLGVNTVLEIELVSATTQGYGHGTKLMAAFMSQSFVKEVDAVYLDPSPLMYSLDGVRPEGSEDEVLDRLQRFYQRFGFRNRFHHSRMWIFNKISVPTNELPT